MWTLNRVRSMPFEILSVIRVPTCQRVVAWSNLTPHPQIRIFSVDPSLRLHTVRRFAEPTRWGTSGDAAVGIKTGQPGFIPHIPRERH